MISHTFPKEAGLRSRQKASPRTKSVQVTASATNWHKMKRLAVSCKSFSFDCVYIAYEIIAYLLDNLFL